MTTGALLARLRAIGSVFAEREAALLTEATAGQPALLEALLARRLAGEPLETVLGWVELAGTRFHVERGVFVPRRRSELVVRAALAHTRPGAVLVDLCCGNAAIGCAIADVVPVELHAADCDPTAVSCAAGNVAVRGGWVHHGDLYGALPPGLAGRVDTLAVNAPYVPSAAIATMPPEARDHEPRRALDGGADGLDLHRRVAEGAPEWLAPGGVVVLETSRLQADATTALLAASGLTVELVTDEEIGATVAVGRSRGLPGERSGARWRIASGREVRAAASP